MIASDRPRFHPGQHVTAAAAGPSRATARFVVQAARRVVHGNGTAEWYYAVTAATGSRRRAVMPERYLAAIRRP